MPIYEFECKKCGHECELLVRSTDWHGAKCPKCGSGSLTKKFSLFASKVAGNPASSSSSGCSSARCSSCRGRRCRA
ncbi:MAG: zinc ribbon domain-containing protein [Verrucomicrobiae bacterium]|nr:zinc ribbon domain-containing protein [Verrucomicrobiae bacterium]MCX7723310.1 zinc ribbon domain-containing protein [Verrucomicrobiae bacterium]